MQTPHISLTPDVLGYLGPIPVTDTLVTTYLVMFVLTLLALTVRFTLTRTGTPGTLQIIMEMLIGGIRDAIHGVTNSTKKTLAFLPVIATVFLFVLFQNWSGLIPGLSAIKVYEEGHSSAHTHEEEAALTPAAEGEHEAETALHLFRPGSSDLSFTLALALIAFVLAQYHGVRGLGVFGYLGKFISFKNPIAFFVGILELISEFAKVISFSFRLFGNIFAGKVLLIVIMALVPFVVPVPFYGLELFVGFIQALVFAALMTVFFKLAADH